MASQHVQTYLERNRIGALFEDLMAKVISDTPDEPIPYLIRVLKKMHTQSDGGLKDFGSLPPRSKPPRSMGLTGTQISRHSFDEGFIGKDHRSALARSWAAPEGHAERSKSRPSSGSKVAGREYPRPWLSGSKSTKNVSISKDNIRPRTTHGHSNNERPSWNSKTAVPSHDFDEWFAMQQKPQRTDGEFKHYEEASSWGRNGEMTRPVERLVHYQRGSMPQTLGSYGGDDDLEEELYVGKDVKSLHEESEQSSVVSYGSSRSGKLKARHAAEEHRRQLQALLMNKDQRNNYGNYEMNDSEDHHDDGTELLENIDELESEGVANVHKKGSRISKSMKYGTAPSETIQVSICARCAKIITGQQSDQKSEVGSVYWASEVDDNFDSVSQVGSTAGLNRPTVWPTGFDSESDSSPRNGQHMWQSPSRSPGRGRHMFRGGSFTAEPPDSSRPPTASSSRSDLMLPGKPQRSWNSGGYSSDNDTEVNFGQVGSTGLMGSRSWNRAALESGSETDWYPRKGQRTSGRGRGFAQFDSGGESD